MTEFLPLFSSGPDKISIEDGSLLIFHHQFTNPHHLFSVIEKKTQWRSDTIHLMGREVAIPRLNAWYGDEGKFYSYSGVSFKPLLWYPELEQIKKHVESITGFDFNSALLNYYRDGNDSVDWHADDEPELGTNPVIASVSFGETRRFTLKHKTRSLKNIVLDLQDNSVLFMSGSLQHHWRHKLGKTKKACHPRINITFRKVIN